MSLTIAFDTAAQPSRPHARYKGAATLTINFEIPEADIEKLHTLFVYEECGCDCVCTMFAQHIQHTVESVIWGHLTRGKYDEYCA